ncbi:MAG: hypothetical protein JWO19_4403 [Bryobacterales bacterium]|nr:hypothetical protein [Bryobacterales bacterium]
MAKHKVGVLEAAVSPDSSAPQHYCGRAIAALLIEKQVARKLGKRLIQVLRGTAEAAIEWAKAEREAAIKRWERLQLRLGVGNLVPFSRPTDPGQHFHYEIPHAGDAGPWRRHFRKKIRVSARPRQSTFMPATAAPMFAPRLADAFSR